MEACYAEGSKSRGDAVPQISLRPLAHQNCIRRDRIVAVAPTNGDSGQSFGLVFSFKLSQQPLCTVAQCAPEDKIYIDPRLVPRQANMSPEQFKAIILSPGSTPEMKAWAQREYTQKCQAIVVPYGTGQGSGAPNQSLYSAIYFREPLRPS